MSKPPNRNEARISLIEEHIVKVVLSRASTTKPYMKCSATYLSLCVFFGVRFGLHRVLYDFLLFETSFEVFD